MNASLTDVLAKAILQYEQGRYSTPSSPEQAKKMAAHQAEAIAAAELAVVELPQPISGDEGGWAVGEEDFQVHLIALQRVLDGSFEVGVRISWGSVEFNLSRADGNALAAALLAAAARAEAGER